MNLRLFSIGHGNLDAGTFTTYLRANGIEAAIDVRRFPASRMHPQFDAAALAESLRAAGVVYRPMPELGGGRVPLPNSPHVALREASFRGFADYMQTAEFATALIELLMVAADRPAAMFCSETLWWRCHRRLIADAIALVYGGEVTHLVGAMTAVHVPTPGVRQVGKQLIYDGRVQRLM